jgi:hypothetical protein
MKQTKPLASGFPVDEVIESLRFQLAEKDAEIERLKRDAEEWKQHAKEVVSGEFDKIIGSFEIEAQLAASQAREQQLRGSMDDYFNQYPHMAKGYILDALALPQDYTALCEMIAEAGEVMRWRTQCAYSPDMLPNDWIDAIRALPGVTLKELQG